VQNCCVIFAGGIPESCVHSSGMLKFAGGQSLLHIARKAARVEQPPALQASLQKFVRIGSDGAEADEDEEASPESSVASSQIPPIIIPHKIIILLSNFFIDLIFPYQEVFLTFIIRNMGKLLVKEAPFHFPPLFWAAKTVMIFLQKEV
jgi:hypothetical protein